MTPEMLRWFSSVSSVSSVVKLLFRHCESLIVGDARDGLNLYIGAEPFRVRRTSDPFASPIKPPVNSLWNDKEAADFGTDPLKLRAYTSRLLGQESSLVLHGGGNTSVKADAPNLFGDMERLLHIKGSGWDLATIQPAGFAPVKLDVLLRMAELPVLSDADMVRAQRAAMTDPSAPSPSVEAILHAIIPFDYVDHTHADATVAVSNTAGGDERIREIYGDRVLYVPYVMPGFALARKVYEMTRKADWSQLDGIVLLHHGVFSFGNTARESYERMIELVTRAEHYLERHGAVNIDVHNVEPAADVELHLARLRAAVSRAAGRPMILQLDASAEALSFGARGDVRDIATRGPLTPDHVIRTKVIPLVLGDESAPDAVARYAESYRAYFDRHASADLRCLDPAPRWIVWPGRGTVAIGASVKDAAIVTDIARHTVRAVQWAQSLGGWQALGEAELFDVEYWELEQAKLRGGGAPLPLQGRVAIVTGAASGIGRACAEMLAAHGAAVMALDINHDVERIFAKGALVGNACDVTDADAVTAAVHATVRRFGGLDILVSNAGLFTPSQTLEQMADDVWSRSLDLNLTSHQRLLRTCIPFLREGAEPAVVIMASKNVPAPGPGAGAYSVAKAGLTQLGRIAALELAKDGIRVNMLHPHAVFDTGAWTPEVLAERAKAYGLTAEQYKSNNLLRIEVTSRDVAALACAMAGPVFRATTGAQVPVDGGNERVV